LKKKFSVRSTAGAVERGNYLVTTFLRRNQCKGKGIIMRELRTEIEIAAPITKVWSILTDFDTWKEWNPIVNQASGVASPGSKLSITMCGADGKDANNYRPIVTNVEEPKSFRWRAKMMAGFLFTNDKVFELDEISSGTRLIHIEAFSGILVPMFWSKLNKGVLPMLKSMNDALKILAEKSSD
jgi:hypothetical protein